MYDTRSSDEIREEAKIVGQAAESINNADIMKDVENQEELDKDLEETLTQQENVWHKKAEASLVDKIETAESKESSDIKKDEYPREKVSIIDSTVNLARKQSTT